VQRLLKIAILLIVAAFSLGGAAQAAAQSGAKCPLISSENQQSPAATLDEAFCAMYDLDFRSADSDLARYVTAHPEDPLGTAAQAASVLFSIFAEHKILQSELFVSDDRYKNLSPVRPDGPSVHRFESALTQAEKLALEGLARNRSNKAALFSLALVYGLRADYAALIEHRDLAALRFSSKANEWAGKLLAISPNSYDALVATGIQKYLVGLRPAPVRWMLRVGGIKGDRDEGIRELELASTQGHYLAPFARILLAVAHLRKLERKEAFDILSGLRRQFPNNPLFAEEMARIAEGGSTSGR
jgi:hypothetical protein